MARETKSSLVNGTASLTRTDKIRILTLVIEQMRLMINENERLILLNDDVEGRTYLNTILQDEIRKNNLKIDKIKQGEDLQLTFFQRWSDEDDI